MLHLAFGRISGEVIKFRENAIAGKIKKKPNWKFSDIACLVEPFKDLLYVIYLVWGIMNVAG